MKIKEHQSIRLDGFWTITEASACKRKNNQDIVDDEYIIYTKGREGELVVFPYSLDVGETMKMVYCFSSSSKRNGRMLRTSTVEKIHEDATGAIQVSTLNTQYVFVRYDK